jgi:hypothetical protein
MQSLKLSSKPGSAEDLRKTILKVLLKHDSKVLSFVDNITSRIPSLEAETIVIATKRR